MTLVWVCAAVVVRAGVALAEDCSVCTECSADPAFVQRDMRSPHLLLMLKPFASRKMQEEGVSTIVVFSEGDSGQPTHTVVLLGHEGGSESVKIKGDLPSDFKALVGAE
jgi:hypothetical protein